MIFEIIRGGGNWLGGERMGRPTFSPGKEWAGPFFPRGKNWLGEIPACYTGNRRRQFFCNRSRRHFSFFYELLRRCKYCPEPYSKPEEVVQHCATSHRMFFLAHLSRRLTGELIVYQSLRRPSVVRPSVRLSVRPSTFSNIFSSETTGPIKLKFHMETP